MDPLVPSRSDFRLLKKLVSALYGGKVEQRPDEFDRVCTVFERAGGSWVRLYAGSFEELNLLKRVVRVAYQKGHLTRSPGWT